MNDHLERVLFEWEYADFFTVRNSLQSALILGETGSGKTTSSFSLLAGHYLSNGYGILALICKQDEISRWQSLCKAYKREKDLVIFGPDSGEYFNFFEYMLSSKSDGKGIAHNIADALKTVIKSGNQDGNESDKAFWDSTLQQLLVNAVDLCLLTKNNKFEHVYQIVQSAPRNSTQLKSVEWRQSSKCFRLMEHVAQHLKEQPVSKENSKLERRLRNIEDFFLGSWLHLSEKTRSIVEQMFFGFGDRFMREPIYSLMNSTHTTISPDDTIEGKVIVLNLPYMIFDKTGQDIQTLWKHLWQKSMQKREIENTSRPCTIFIDEFQNFTTDNDPQFQSTCRSYRACCVYATQNLPNFFLNAGSGETGRTRFKALAGNISTKFFHANSDPETNEYAADLIGKDYLWTDSRGESFGEGFSFNSGQSESLEYIVPPATFTQLKTGGPENDFLTEAIIHRQGKPFISTGKNYKKVTLKQILL
ncbi:type IV secretory system conjugative DNA transfer family protein [Flavisericum labens]|uniref:type IV secretory system conjugative DNA transfer family protein n=1 Tax=Flavisericum labens TaxID=3377112 RepID=UPI00387B063C